MITHTCAQTMVSHAHDLDEGTSDIQTSYDGFVRMNSVCYLVVEHDGLVLAARLVLVVSRRLHHVLRLAQQRQVHQLVLSARLLHKQDRLGLKWRTVESLMMTYLVEPDFVVWRA